MANGICDVCKRRSATHSVRVIRNGDQTRLELCNIDYARLRQQQSMDSPVESLFTGDSPFDLLSSDFPKFMSQMGDPVPRDVEATNIEEFLSEHAKELIQKAGDTAVKFGQREVDTEHLLYALMDSDVVIEILRQFKVQPAELKTYLESNSPKGKVDTSKGPVQLTVSPRIKNVLETAFGVSQELGHGYIGPEHLLIALSQENEGLAGDVLRKYGLTASALRQKVVKVVGRGAQEGRITPVSTTPQLDKYSRDLSALAKQGKLDPVIGRGKEIEITIEVLSRRTKNNPALIGEPGVGKTAIVEGLAQRIVNRKVPEVLQDKRVVEVNLNSVVAGSKYRGEFEERIKSVLDEIVANKDELIVFIDELHTIVGAGQGGDDGGLDVANVIKPSLARGELHLIGATTLNEYQKHIERDAALERRFQPVLVGEPTVDQTIEILRGLRDRYEAHHKVKIADDAIVSAAALSDRYITGRFLPDKAIDLIDQAAARVRIGSDAFSSELTDLDESIWRTKRELESATNHKHYDEASNLEKELASLSAQKDSLASERHKHRVATSRQVSQTDVAQVVSSITGIPVSELTKEEKEKLLKMEEQLHERVIGQEEAVGAVSDAVRLSRAGLAERSKPIATLLFLGPSGVGKTELAKALAWSVFGDEQAVIRLDMSEYMERYSVSRLVGAPPGYVGYDEGGQLTERVRRRPYSVLLLDEIEKASSDVHNVLLQVFDDGRLTDGKGRVVDFSNTLIIATSNVGADMIQDQLKKPDEDKKSYDDLKSELTAQLRVHFRPEFLNRIDEIIVFHALNMDQIKDIAKLQLERVKRVALGQGVELTFDDSVVNHLAEVGYAPEYGARELKRKVKVEVENKLARELLNGNLYEGASVEVSYDFESKTIVFTPSDQQPDSDAQVVQSPERELAFREKLDNVDDNRPTEQS